MTKRAPRAAASPTRRSIAARFAARSLWVLSCTRPTRRFAIPLPPAVTGLLQYPRLSLARYLNMLLHQRRGAVAVARPQRVENAVMLLGHGIVHTVPEEKKGEPRVPVPGSLDQFDEERITRRP